MRDDSTALVHDVDASGRIDNLRYIADHIRHDARIDLRKDRSREVALRVDDAPAEIKKRPTRAYIDGPDIHAALTYRREGFAAADIAKIIFRHDKETIFSRNLVPRRIDDGNIHKILTAKQRNLGDILGNVGLNRKIGMVDSGNVFENTELRDHKAPNLCRGSRRELMSELARVVFECLLVACKRNASDDDEWHERNAREQYYEFGMQPESEHDQFSYTWLTCRRNDCGSSIPIARAVAVFTLVSKVTASSIGMSEGCTPRRISPARRAA